MTPWTLILVAYFAVNCLAAITLAGRPKKARPAPNPGALAVEVILLVGIYAGMIVCALGASGLL